MGAVTTFNYFGQDRKPAEWILSVIGIDAGQSSLCEVRAVWRRSTEPGETLKPSEARGAGVAGES
jgi:hypothetical protein